MTRELEYLPYTHDLLNPSRRPTREVRVGDVGVGSNNPIRVQSMTTTLTKDVTATADQAERLVRAGCEIVRITTPTPEDSRRLGEIRAKLEQRGIRVPLVADIHFSPMAAMVAAEHADKVRVNPGNYVDSRKFAVKEYTDSTYEEEVERMAERFSPLVLKCRDRGVAMRIGTNHGSLSDRIMNRFGDTPEGMVESALEFVRVCEANSYYDIILSMKASNPKVMIEAYRLLAARMGELGMDYPFHLGVTEAGNGEDGRIKSAVGIGSLLRDGIGDTIRVSLTEEPEEEIPVALALAGRDDSGLAGHVACLDTRRRPAGIAPFWNPYHYERRASRVVRTANVEIGGDMTVSVIATLANGVAEPGTGSILLRWASPAGRRQPKPDAVWIEVGDEAALNKIGEHRIRLAALNGASLALIAAGDQPSLLCRGARRSDVIGLLVGPRGVDHADMQIVSLEALGSKTPIIVTGRVIEREDMEDTVDQVVTIARQLVDDGVAVAVSLQADDLTIPAFRLLAIRCHEKGLDAPIILQTPAPGEDGSLRRLLEPSINLGSLLTDGIGDAAVVHGSGDTVGLAFNILQATGTRIFKTDYVACPSCGRTLFDLQETTERIKARTSHLVGVRLAIMGCIVNGPGEMADADFGYVGGAPGRVNLYVGKECVERGVPAEEADDRLITIIKSRGKWEEAEDEPA